MKKRKKILQFDKNAVIIDLLTNCTKRGGPGRAVSSMGRGFRGRICGEEDTDVWSDVSKCGTPVEGEHKSHHRGN